MCNVTVESVEITLHSGMDGRGEMSESDTIKTMDMLMGKSESGARRDWLEERGNEVEADI